MRTRRCLVAAWLGVAVLVAFGMAQAAPFYQCDFESPTYSLGGGVVGKGTPPWQLWNVDATVVAVPGGGGGQCGQWVGDYTENGDATDVFLSFAGLGTVKDLEIRQRCYYPSSNPTSRDLIFDINLGAAWPRLVFGQGWYVGWTQQPVWQLNGVGVSGPLSYDAWHEAVLTVHYGPTTTLDFSVDGSPIATGFASPGLGELKMYDPWADDADSAPGQTLVDDILITQLEPVEPAGGVPEPGTLALVLLCLPLFRRRRA